jgi:hypothetical protein
MKFIENNCLTALLRYNLHEFLVVANCERILVLDANTNYLLDVIKSL